MRDSVYMCTREKEFSKHFLLSQVEIFVKSSSESAGFMRLGYLSFDSNERSQHQARELKSVHIDAVADTVKLVVHQCHANKLNIYSQVRYHHPLEMNTYIVLAGCID